LRHLRGVEEIAGERLDPVALEGRPEPRLGEAGDGEDATGEPGGVEGPSHSPCERRAHLAAGAQDYDVIGERPGERHVGGRGPREQLLELVLVANGLRPRRMVRGHDCSEEERERKRTETA
jgi:hypothetical protein